jgi:hypothetical protein
MTTSDISEPDRPPSSADDPNEPHPSGGVPATNVFGHPGGNLESGDKKLKTDAHPEEAAD